MRPKPPLCQIPGKIAHDRAKPCFPNQDDFGANPPILNQGLGKISHRALGTVYRTPVLHEKTNLENTLTHVIIQGNRIVWM